MSFLYFNGSLILIFFLVSFSSFFSDNKGIIFDFLSIFLFKILLSDSESLFRRGISLELDSNIFDFIL